MIFKKNNNNSSSSCFFDIWHLTILTFLNEHYDMSDADFGFVFDWTEDLMFWTKTSMWMEFKLTMFMREKPAF